MIAQGPTYWSKASCIFEGCVGSYWAHRRLFARYYDGECMLKIFDDTWAAIDTWGLSNQVAWIEEPHTVHGAHDTASFRCIHEQSQCKRPHQVLGSAWARSAIGREWKHRHWEESKTSKGGQC
jgi:hypothetical protein